MSLKQGGIADIFQMFYSINLKSRIIPTLQSDDMPTCAHHSLENFLRVSTSDKRITLTFFKEFMFYSINLKSRIRPTLQSDDMPTCAHHSLENFLRVSTSDKRITFNVEPCRLFNYCPRCDNLSRLEILTSEIEII